MNNILILDIGNSLIKISMVNVESIKIIKTYLFGTRNLYKWKNDIIKLLSELEYQKVIVGSVVPSINDEIKNLFPRDKNIYFLKHSDFKNIEFNDNYNYEKVGLDILGFSYFLMTNSKKSIGVSFGTAIFSVMIENNKILGLSIFPSIKKAFEDLEGRTELINKVDIKNVRKEFGFNTEEAMESGYYHVLYGMLSSVFNYAYNEYGITEIFIAGGNYKNIDKIEFNEKFTINSNEEQIVTLGYLLIYKNFLN